MIFIKMRSKDKSLDIPFVVDDQCLNSGRLSNLLDLCETKIGGLHFRGRDNFLETLKDHRKKAEDYEDCEGLIYGPFVGVSVIDGVKRVTVHDEPPAGCTCYDYAQVVSLVDGLDGTETLREFGGK